jgi:hypothetical protein
VTFSWLILLFAICPRQPLVRNLRVSRLFVISMTIGRRRRLIRLQLDKPTRLSEEREIMPEGV